MDWELWCSETLRNPWLFRHSEQGHIRRLLSMFSAPALGSRVCEHPRWQEQRAGLVPWSRVPLGFHSVIEVILRAAWRAKHCCSLYTAQASGGSEKVSNFPKATQLCEKAEIPSNPGYWLIAMFLVITIGCNWYSPVQGKKEVPLCVRFSSCCCLFLFLMAAVCVQGAWYCLNST